MNDIQETRRTEGKQDLISGAGDVYIYNYKRIDRTHYNVNNLYPLFLNIFRDQLSADASHLIFGILTYIHIYMHIHMYISNSVNK